MKKAPKLAQEELRLQKLRDYQVLDTEIEECFQEIVELASEICECPISLVSLIDQDRQWFKARLGLDAESTDRDISFCGHAIEGEQLFEVKDSRLDDRFKDNPLVVGMPEVIFYAGQPLVTPDGFKIGTLCVIDSQPRQLSCLQKKTLATLSHSVVQILESRLQSRLASRSLQREFVTKKTSQSLLEMVEEVTRTALFNISGVIEEFTAGPNNEKTIAEVKILKAESRELNQFLSTLLTINRITVSETRVGPKTISISELSQYFPSRSRETVERILKGRNEAVVIDEELLSCCLNTFAIASKFYSPEYVFDFEFDSGGETPEILLFSKNSTQTRSNDVSVRHQELAGEYLGQLVSLLKGTLRISESFLELKVPLSILETSQSDFKKETSDSEMSNCYGEEILVVEDNEINRLVIGKILTKLGVKYDYAFDGKLALERLSKKEYSLVLMDILMPTMNGIECAEAIRKSNDGQNEIPIIALTASPIPQFKEDCFRVGMNDFLTKPVDINGLSETLGKYITLKPIQTIDQVEEGLPMVESLVDITVIEALIEEYGDEDLEFIGQLVDKFIETGDEKVGKMNELIKTQAWEELSRNFHSMKPTAFMLGSKQLGESCLSLETKYKNSPMSVDMSEIENFKESYSQVVVELNQFLGRVVNESENEVEASMVINWEHLGDVLGNDKEVIKESCGIFSTNFQAAFLKLNSLKNSEIPFSINDDLSILTNQVNYIGRSDLVELIISLQERIEKEDQQGIERDLNHLVSQLELIIAELADQFKIGA